ncbi:MAG TPA: hypothetical protein VK894_10040 [Jiangellales bacterium]|nr:hypothetical protein [Jiangellales bacterium]
MPSHASRPAAVAVLLAAAVIGFGGGAVLGQQVGGSGEAESAATAAPDAADVAPEPGISLVAEPASASANQDVRLDGTVVPAVGGVSLQVERSLDGGDWQEFPVTTTTRDDGTFGVTVRTGRSGENRFRVVGEVEGQPMSSNEVPVVIG